MSSQTRQLFLAAQVLLFVVLCGQLTAQRSYRDYPAGYPFGAPGSASHPNGYDGWPGDTPAGTPGAPAGTPPNGGPGGNGFGSGSGGVVHKTQEIMKVAPPLHAPRIQKTR